MSQLPMILLEVKTHKINKIKRVIRFHLTLTGICTHALTYTPVHTDTNTFPFPYSVHPIFPYNLLVEFSAFVNFNR